MSKRFTNSLACFPAARAWASKASAPNSAAFSPVVTESYELFRCSEEGRIEEASETALCFLNIASRLKGEEVPLFSGMREEKKLRRSLLGF